MKRITFFAAFIVAILAFNTNSAKAQVSAHIGINIGRPAYYAPAREVVVVDRPVYHRRPVVVYHEPVRHVYYGRPAYHRRGYYRPAPRRVVVVDHGYGRGHGRGHGHGRW